MSTKKVTGIATSMLVVTGGALLAMWLINNVDFVDDLVG